MKSFWVMVIWELFPIDMTDRSGLNLGIAVRLNQQWNMDEDEAVLEVYEGGICDVISNE